jgi:hypothetical protein
MKVYILMHMETNTAVNTVMMLQLVFTLKLLAVALSTNILLYLVMKKVIGPGTLLL